MGFEYMFFDEALRDRFVGYIADRGIEAEVRTDIMAGYTVEVPEGLPEDLMDALDAESERLMNEQMVLAEHTEGWVTHQVVGINVSLADGKSFVVRLPAVIGRQLLATHNPQEAQALVTAIAESMVNPIDGPLCKKA